MAEIGPVADCLLLGREVCKAAIPLPTRLQTFEPDKPVIESWHLPVAEPARILACLSRMIETRYRVLHDV